MTAAAARAAHLIVDAEPLIFRDTLAFALLGERAEELVAYHRLHGTHPVLAGARTAVVTRSRFTEDRLAAGGLTQYVILGAGLDSYAHRSPSPHIRVFEVDHPATQEWKKARLAEAGVPHPPTLSYVPVDLEAESFADRLVAQGFDPAVPAFVSWLGVTMYLTREAIGQTLKAVSGFAAGSEIVVDHMLPAELRDAAGQAYVDAVMPTAAEQGEPWLSFLAPPDMAALLREHGLEVVEHVRQRETVDAALWNRADPLRPSDLSILTRACLSRL